MSLLLTFWLETTIYHIMGILCFFLSKGQGIPYEKSSYN
jgi:hypothetical protein